MLNKDIIQGHWREAKGKLKQQWGELTDDDLTQLTGTYEELEGLLQTKYGYAKERADKEIDDFIDSNHWH
jgi:uncharacterized protein YjbJ (UPF0337 family)